MIALAALAGAVAAWPAGVAVAAEAQPGIVLPGLPEAEATGRDFAGLKLGMPVQIGALSISAARVNCWSEQPAPGPRPGTTLGGVVQRMFLRGDVRVVIGATSFMAARAVVWLEQLETPGPAGGPNAQGLWQVAVYFDRVGDPSAMAGSAQSADRLLVTGLVRTDPTIGPDLLLQGRPDGEPLIAEGEERFAKYLTALMAPKGKEVQTLEIPVYRMTGMEQGQKSPMVPGRSQPFEPDSPLADPNRMVKPGASVIDSGSAAPGAAPTSRKSSTGPLFGSRGVFTVAAGDPRVVLGAEESMVIVTGGVVVMYTDAQADRALQMSAERAVVFLDGGPVQNLLRSPADKVRGIYLEGDVLATDGSYTYRGAQVYYDVKANRAFLIDAVFWTYDQKIGLPFYLRAKAINQTAVNQLQADDVRMATSSFFTPHISIGATSVTVTRNVPPGQVAQTIINARNVTGRLGDLPFFWWPHYEGEPGEVLLREVGFTGSSTSGPGIKTRWDFFGLIGVKPPDDMEATAALDYFTKRGVALGLNGLWDTPERSGRFFTYFVPNDHGTDQLSSGATVDQDGDFRGIVTAEHRWAINSTWSMFLEGEYISDANFTDAYFESMAETRREFTNAVTVRAISDNTMFSLLGKTNFNDFTANEYLLESLGYDVTKLPEARYVRVGDDVLSGVAPGLLSYSSEYRAGEMKLHFTQPTASQLGFTTPTVSQDALGIQPNQSPAQRLAAEGLTEDAVFRFDTRQELSMNLEAGPVKLTPFGVGRFTTWNDSFAAYANGGDDSKMRYWGSAGLRAATSLQHIDGSAESELLDIHKIRNVIEPSATVWTSGTNRDQSTLPVYDDRVESIAEGTAARAGVTSTWQTLRGSAGRYHTSDFLKMSADVVWSSSNTPQESPIGRFFDYRPEYSMLGKYGTFDGVWKITDSLALAANDVFDFDLNQQAKTVVGVKIDHSADFSSFAEVRYINARNATYFDFGGDLRVSSKYKLAGVATYDTDLNEFQGVAGQVWREFPDVLFGMTIRYDNITGELSFGINFKPVSQDDRSTQLARLARGRIDPGLGEPLSDSKRGSWFGDGSDGTAMPPMRGGVGGP